MKDFRAKIMGRLGNNLFQFAYLYSQVRDGKLPNIYLQDPIYFERYGYELKKLLSEGIGKIDKVGIHVRRGDYINNPFYTDLFKKELFKTEIIQNFDYDFGSLEELPNYYERAMKRFPNKEFLVFSDDIEWCKQQPIFENCTFSEGYSEEEDLNRFASCTNHIIANSSFSWWGAWLSPHGGIVIAPAKWYADGVERTTLPDSWIKI